MLLISGPCVVKIISFGFMVVTAGLEYFFCIFSTVSSLGIPFTTHKPRSDVHKCCPCWTRIQKRINIDHFALLPTLIPGDMFLRTSWELQADLAMLYVQDRMLIKQLYVRFAPQIPN